jgi:hypothetical protein
MQFKINRKCLEKFENQSLIERIDGSISITESVINK